MPPVKGLGPIAGVLSGWGLLLGYMVTGMSTLCGFGIFADMLLAQVEDSSPDGGVVRSLRHCLIRRSLQGY
jgi:hypothetical protein